MSLKGTFAVVSFVGLMVASNLASARLSSFSFSSTPVGSGMPTTVKVTAAPCAPVSVVIHVGGRQIAGEIIEVPGSVTLDIPEGLSALPYTLEVRCPTDRAAECGVVM